MTNFDYEDTILGYIPPLILRTLLEDKSFQEEFGLKINPIISFLDSGVYFQRSDLYNAVRKILSDTPESEVTDMDDHKWKLQDISEENELPNLVLSQGEQRISMPNFSVLSSNSATRLRFLEESALDYNMPKDEQEKWHNVLVIRALEDDEYDSFYEDLHNTPIKIAHLIHNETVEGNSRISSLIPPSIRYFEKLVGEYDGSVSIHDYATGGGKDLLSDLSAWKAYDGFLYSLFLSSHPSLTAEIDVDKLTSIDLIHAFEFLEKQGDKLSQLGAIEVGLRVLPSQPEIEPILVRIIEQIRDDDVNGETSEFQLLSALFIFVDGELSRTRLLSELPPFYRRLAALSQASLIHREYVSSDIDIDRFCKWAHSHYEGLYYLQSFTDMRMEPRWSPYYASASQIKADFFGRIVIAAIKYEENIKDSKIFDIILSTNPESLVSLYDLSMYFPGPLEGAVETRNLLPIEFSEIIEKHLITEEVEPSSFIALINSALFFHLEKDHVELAAKALKIANYRLKNIESRSQFVGVINGLAMVAAVTRSRMLAEELRILVRIYLHNPEYALSIKEAMDICLVASASCSDLNDWRDYVGDWLTELAFEDLKGNDGEVFHSKLRYLCHVVPKLWVSCGKADAALTAYNATSISP